MLYEIVHEFPNDFIFDKDEPAISLYQPTHRNFPENKQDPIVFKNLISRIEKSLEQEYKGEYINSMLKPLYQIKKDRLFWDNTLDGLAILANKKRCIVYLMQKEVKEFAVVDDNFYIKPLIQYFQRMNRYHILGVSRKDFELYQGNKEEIYKIKIDSQIPKTLEEVLGEEVSDPHLNFGSYSGKGKAAYHGHEDVSEETKKDAERYFRYIDKFVFENYSNKIKIPLILVSLDENQSIFRSISNNPYLIDDGINKSYSALNNDKLRKKAIEILEPINEEKIKKAVDAFRSLEAKDMASTDIENVAVAIIEGRVKKVLIEENKIIPGEINSATGEIEYGDIEDPDCGDIIDDIGEMVMKNHGEVMVLEKEKMPGDTGIAAMFRY